MTVYTLTATAPGLELAGGSVLALEAIDPTTGAAVTGVTVGNIAVYGEDISDQLTGSLVDEIPRFTPEELPPS